jgi:hypothetical protein
LAGAVPIAATAESAATAAVIFKSFEDIDIPFPICTLALHNAVNTVITFSTLSTKMLTAAGQKGVRLSNGTRPDSLPQTRQLA